jgi:Flp pilus assembly protein TadG
MHNMREAKKLAPAMDESGAVAVTVALALTALCGFVAMAVDVGHLVTTKTELQRTVDAAALAGAMGLAPYTGPLTDQTPNWSQGESTAHTLISNAANQADNQIFSSTDGTVTHGYWLLNPPTDYVQSLPQARPTTTACWEPAINVTLSRNVTLSFAPLVGISSPTTVSAAATAILIEAYSLSGLPPIALAKDTVYNNVNGTLVIDVSEQDIKPQSNKGIAGWFNLDTVDNKNQSVPSVEAMRNTTLTSLSDQIHMVPGTKARLTDFISEGETIVMPFVNDADLAAGNNAYIQGFAAFKIDSLDANSMTGHFVNKFFDPKVIPHAYNSTNSPVWSTPKLVK